MAVKVFCEVTRPLNILLVNPWVQVDTCAKFKGTPLRHSWDIVFTRMGRTDEEPENITHPVTAVSSMDALKML